MQSIAADCAPIAKMLHHRRVNASAAERRSRAAQQRVKRRHLQPYQVADDLAELKQKSKATPKVGEKRVHDE